VEEINSKTYSILKEETSKYKSDNCHFKKVKYSFPGEKNAMYRRSVYSVWVETYGVDIANKKLVDWKKTQSNNNTGEGNPMFGRIRKGEIQKYDPINAPRVWKVSCILCKKEVSWNTLEQHQSGGWCIINNKDSIKCEICGRCVQRDYLKKHQLTKLCYSNRLKSE